MFARDGFHGANLEVIANQAGYSKGAVYSNFEGKAELFLAVMDRNLAAVQGGGFDPFEPLAPAADTDHHGSEDLAELMRGLGLAMLALPGIEAADAALLRTGLRRLLDPARALEAGPVEDDAGPRALHGRALQRHLYGQGR